MSDYKSIKIDKGLYAGKGFSYNLEQLDPSENYKGTSLEGLDAFARQLKRFDIKVSGNNSDVIDKFFSSSQTAALFPEFVVRTVESGIDGAETLSEISAVKTRIEGLDYRSIISTLTDPTSSHFVSEGEEIPEVNIALSNDLVTMRKYGRMLSASYEALRFQKINVFAIALRQIGKHIANAQVEDALGVLYLGNSGNEHCGSDNTGGALTYADLVDFYTSFGDYSMSHIFINPESLSVLLNMQEFRDAAAGLNFHATGNLITPFGAKIIRTNYVPKNSLLAIDRNYALETVQSGDVTVESDKLINRQLERVAVTSTCGFNRITADAVKALTFSE